MNSINDAGILKRTCPICEKVYSVPSNLNRHLKEYHNEDKQLSLSKMNKKDKYLFKCLEGCDLSFRYNLDLRTHLNRTHMFNIHEKVIRFQTKEGFDKWFTDVKEAGSHYIILRGVKCSMGRKTTYFQCNRSGIARKKVIDRKRKEKKYGSRKINAGCTSVIKLEEYHGSCIVTYCDSHYGHKIELEHLPIPPRTRADIINELERGARIIKVNLQDGFDHIELNNLQRSRILTSADLKNLRKNTKNHLKIPPIEIIENINDKEIVSTTFGYPFNENAKPANENMESLSVNDETEERIEIQMEVEVEDYITEETLIENDGNTMDESEENNENTLDESEEEAYGRYVANELRKMKPQHSEAAKTQINNILKFYLKL